MTSLPQVLPPPSEHFWRKSSLVLSKRSTRAASNQRFSTFFCFCFSNGINYDENLGASQPAREIHLPAAQRQIEEARGNTIFLRPSEQRKRSRVRVIQAKRSAVVHVHSSPSVIGTVSSSSVLHPNIHTVWHSSTKVDITTHVQEIS